MLVLTGGGKLWAEETVKYALAKSEMHASGESVTLTKGEETVATLTFGEAGGDEFKAATANSSVSGFSAFTEGNGTNGNKAKGTFYFFQPQYDGTATFAVVLNANKEFYIEEDGTALSDFNGIKVTTKYFGTYTCNVKAGSTYKVYCAGSKLGFYGVEYSYTKTNGGGGSTPEPDPTPEPSGFTASNFYVVKEFDFTNMPTTTLVIQSTKAGSIWNQGNNKKNDVFRCTNAGLESLAVQAVYSSKKGFTIENGPNKGLLDRKSVV